MKARMFKRVCVCLLFTMACDGLAANLRNATLQIVRTNSMQVTVSWQGKSAVPSPGFQIVPDYQIEKSTNLGTWTAFGAKLTGVANNQSLRVLDAAPGAAAFYRVKSVINRPFGIFNQANLGNGELAVANFFGAEFFSAALTNANLTGADLRGADLRFAKLDRSIAVKAGFFGADMFAITAEFVNWQGADISFCGLELADLFGADLRGADLRSTILSGADLGFTSLQKSLINPQTQLDLKGIRIWQLVNHQATNSVFTNLDLGLADLRDSDLRQLNFNATDFSSSDLTGSDLRGANFTNANLRFVIFNNTQMDSNTVIEAKSRLVWEIVNLGAVGRDLHGTNLSSTILLNADMRGANLTNANLSLAVAEFANLGGANLRNANLNSVDFFRATFTNASLNSANFSLADLTQANLFGATTNGTIFTGATFFQTIMPDGSVRNF